MQNASRLKKEYAIAALLFIAVYAFVHHVFADFTVHLLNLTGIWIILALSLGLVIGYIGEISIGHAAFFGIGAYSSALLTQAGLSFWVALPAAALITTGFGYVIGRISLKVSGPYFAICTLGFGEIIKIMLINLRDLTGGPDGISMIRPFDPIHLPFGITIEFTTKAANFWMIYVFVLLTVYVIYQVIHSRVGYAILSVREDPEYSQFIGIDAMKCKRAIFVLSTFFCGLAGCLFAHYVGYISPYSFTTSQSFDLIVMVLIGGSGTIAGPAIGAFILTFLPEFLQAIQDYRMVVYGLLLMVLIIFFPGGLYGFLRKMAAALSRPVYEKEVSR